MATEVANSSVAIAMAIVGRNTRACDVCASKSAHWFCAADDAYLCKACDTQVHSANALSLRHERVRLSVTGTPTKPSSSPSPKVPKREASSKKLHASPPQVAPVRKRSRTARPYSHHLKKLTQVVKVEDHQQSKLELFDFLDGEEFLVRDDNQEVPSLLPAHDSSSSELGILSPESDHSASAESFSSFFKSKAAHSHGDQFLVSGAGLLVAGSDVSAASSEDVDVPGDAFFLPGDIPGLGGFDEVDLSDDFSLSFDLALQNNNNNNRLEAFEGEEEGGNVATCKVEEDPLDQFTGGPFAKFFATKTKAELMQPTSPERIASQAREILKCCRGDVVPSLQLNLGEVLAAWSERGDLWIHPSSEDSRSSGSSDAGVVPDMDAAPGDDVQSGAARDARVLRYKEKRRTRLFSKKIRYEVRKLNAERRPRMKGRFVKRTSTSTSPP